MANRYANLVGSNKIKDEWQKINQGFDLVQADMDTKADSDDLASLESTVTNHIGAGGSAHAEATDQQAGFMSAQDKQKLDGIESGAQVNQNAFAKVNELEADDPSDTVTITGGTGITVTSNPNTKEVIITATGEATPGPHGPSHTEHGADPIPAATTAEGGLMSAAQVQMLESHASRHAAGGPDPITPEMIGAETPEGAQEKADTAEANVKAYADQIVAAHQAEKAEDDVHDLLTDGKIIEESGSNANGQYVRFADGTQICWRKIEVDTSKTDAQTFAFPASFSVNREYIAVGYGLHLPGQNQMNAWYEGRGVVASSESSWLARSLSDQSSITPVVELKVIAIGRWK